MNCNKRLKKNIKACANNECNKCSKNDSYTSVTACLYNLLNDALKRIENLKGKIKS